MSQICFEGFEKFLKAPWSPIPETLAKIQRYFEGYRANEREIFAKRSYIAARVGVKVRTLARYLKHLREVGWMETTRRTARAAIRRVIGCLRGGPSRGPSSESAPYSYYASTKRGGIPPAKTLPEKPRSLGTDWHAMEKLFRAGVPFDEAVRRAEVFV